MSSLDYLLLAPIDQTRMTQDVLKVILNIIEIEVSIAAFKQDTTINIGTLSLLDRLKM